jgi:hypothetical protein
MLGFRFWWRPQQQKPAKPQLGSIFELHDTATIHFPSMILANTSIPMIPVFSELKRQDGPTWLSRGLGDADRPWEPLGQDIKPRVEVAYQRFLRSSGEFSRQDRDWLLLVVKHWVAVRDAEEFQRQGVDPEQFLEIPLLGNRLKEIERGGK